MSKYKFKVDMYRTWVYYHPSVESFEKVSGCDTSRMGGAVYTAPNGDMHIYVPMDEEGAVVMSDLAHEAFHVADFIADKVGLEYIHGTGNEHIAYLVGYVVDHVLELVSKINKGRKKDSIK